MPLLVNWLLWGNRWAPALVEVAVRWGDGLSSNSHANLDELTPHSLHVLGYFRTPTPCTRPLLMQLCWPACGFSTPGTVPPQSFAFCPGCSHSLECFSSHTCCVSLLLPSHQVFAPCRLLRDACPDLQALTAALPGGSPSLLFGFMSCTPLF